ncbi:auxin efflux carrier family protein [Entomortierella parvispora]|uniref:Auxin efflux carrier family protein n=1 Tax=Entomortierella parvispora TaxID=205924 RepID=A0A9P3HAD5_9FUNG|nr:auxin efflux carrier family protein [Entomortierella parvispora]
MDWHVLLGAAAEAESQVITIVLAGVILSRTGYLSQSAQKAISQVNLYFMTPCLLFTKIASTINWDQFKAFWPIPVFFLFFTAVSWVVSRLGSRLLGFSNDEEKFVTASVLFSNTNSLPMALVQSLAMSAAGSHLLRDEHDTKELVAARGISYILFYAIFGNLVRWSYGFTLLVPKDRIELPEDDNCYSLHGQEDAYESPVEDTGPREGVLIDVDDNSSNTLFADSRGSTMSSASSARTLHHFDQGHESYRDSDSDLDDEITDDDDRCSFEHTAPYRSKAKGRGTGRATHLQSLSSPISSNHDYPMRSQHRSFMSSRRRPARPSLRQKAGTAIGRIRQVLTPPLLTALLALVIGLVPALHELFMSPDSKLYTFVVHPIETCGAAAIPMILLCLGAQVVNFASASSSSMEGAHPSSTRSARPGLGSRRRSSNNASIFPHGQMVDQDDTLLSSEEDEEHDLGWLRVQSPPRRKPGRDRRSGNQHALSLPPLSTSSSSSTLFQFNEHGRRGNEQSNELQVEDRANSLLTLLSSENGGSAIPATKDSSSLVSKGYKFKCLTPVGFTLIARLFLVPLICLPVILFYPGSLSPVLTMDPTFRLTLVLLVAAPTAINMIQLCQIKGFFEQPMAAVLFWSYCVFGIPFILGWSLVGLWAAQR